MSIKLILTVWTIRLALLLFALAVLLRLGLGRIEPGRSAGWQPVRLIWVAGCLLAVLHVLAVFGYVMHWSHQAASDHTARLTHQLLGISFGGGVYFNYLFLLVWVGDASWWCGWPDHYLRRAWLWDLLVVGYLWFIAFNATVVFESGAIRWWGLLLTLAIATMGIPVAVARNRLR